MKFTIDLQDHVGAWVRDDEEITAIVSDAIQSATGHIIMSITIDEPVDTPPTHMLLLRTVEHGNEGVYYNESDVDITVGELKKLAAYKGATFQLEKLPIIRPSVTA